MNLSEELERIKDPEIKALTKECLDMAPPHFWYRPASSTGKYHAADENESGGLVIHTKRVCRAGEILIEAWIVPIDADVIRSGCILHDICKYGASYSATKYTQNKHPQIGADFILGVGEGKYDIEKLTKVANTVKYHMGKWGAGFENRFENLIVHLADVVATQMYEEKK